MGSIADFLLNAATRLGSGPHPERARRDAETLLLHVLGKDRTKDGTKDRTWLLTHDDQQLTSAEASCCEELIARRHGGEPIQYIVGLQEFYGLPFRVTPDVLIPRPETEHLVERVIALAGRFMMPSIVDVGTGSGAIAIALAHQLHDARVTALDVSSAALEIARANAAMNAVEGRVDFKKSDLLEEVAARRFEIVVSNPPYVPLAERPSLAVEVREHEPALALFAGEDVARCLSAAHSRGPCGSGAGRLSGSRNRVRAIGNGASSAD